MHRCGQSDPARASRSATVVVHGTAGMIHDFYTGIEKAVSVVTPGWRERVEFELMPLP